MNDKDLFVQDSKQESDVNINDTAPKKTGTRRKSAPKSNDGLDKNAVAVDSPSNPEKPKRVGRPRKKAVTSENSKTDELNSENGDVINTEKSENCSSDTAEKTESFISEETEIDPSVTDEENLNNDEGTESSVLTISSATFDGENYSTVEQLSFLEDDEATDDEPILPPDELFSDRGDDSIAENSFVGTDDTYCNLYEDDVDEDGQYRLTDLDVLDEEVKQEPTECVKPQKYDEKKPRRIDSAFDFIELCVFTLLAVMIITSFFFKHSIVEGSSMENTLHSGEHLIISDLFYTPKRGDIIVCEDYTTSIPRPIVKRVIAIGGDVVKITERGEVFVNNVLLNESEYVFIDDNYQYEEGTWVVPMGELFVMGDHRNKSADSRDIGTVSEDSVLGKVLLRFYPFNKFGKVD